MSKNKIDKNKAVDIEEVKEDKKPTLKQGNYIVEVISEGKVIKKIAVSNSEINVTKLSDGGMTVDLK